MVEGDDGVTHINIYSKAKTELGKWLSNFADCGSLSLPEGNFRTVEGYWMFLKTRDERFKTLNGFECKKLGQSLKSDVEVDEIFREKIKNAIDVKLRNNSSMSKALADSDLPLTHYYQYGSKRVDAGYTWILWHVEDRRKLLKQYYKINE